jgi:hypothetical protein
MGRLIEAMGHGLRAMGYGRKKSVAEKSDTLFFVDDNKGWEDDFLF